MKKDNHNNPAKKPAYIASDAEEQEKLALFHEQGSEFQLKNELFQEISASTSRELSRDLMDKMFTRIWVAIQKKNNPSINKTRFIRGFTKIAAALIVGLVAGILFQIEPKDTNPVFYSCHAPRGSISEVILPDETIIFLNADSRIRYTMNGKEGQREVYLEGEAWFDVAKNDEKQFLVHTSGYDINVTGTQFNVKAYSSDNEIITTLEEGVVKLCSGEQLTIPGEVQMKPGEQVIYNKKSNSLTKNQVNVKWFSSWKDNKLIFVNMSLQDLVVLLERKYGVDIELLNDKLLDMHFDGTLKNETIIELLNIIQKTLPIKYQISGQKIVITPK